MPLLGTSDQKQYPFDFFTGGSLAYLIGINDYRFVPPLASPVNDCLGLKQVLEEKHGFIPKTLFDAEQQEVLNLLEEIKQECKPDSRVIFYFAGHGIADGADDEKQRPKGFLLTVDSERGKKDTYIEMGHVLEVLLDLPCSHLLIILDCCYAGAIRYAEQTRSIGSSVPKTLYAEKFTYYISNPARQVITSAACDQKAMDALGSRGELNANRRSPFAESLIQNLERGDQEWNFGHIQPDGIVTASELGYFLGMEVSDRLSKNNVPFAEQQTPSVFRIGDRTKGEFIFVNSQDAIKKLKPNPLENPWKGLTDYTIKDNHLFYGRQRVLDGWWEGQTWYEGLLQLVSPEENIHKIMVTGRSGSGKSSLVKAGVLARLEAEPKTSVTTITPGSTPFSTHRDLLAALKNKDGKVYLMVDQYEELVTVCSDTNQQKDFEESLAELAALPDAKVIITLRSDLERRFVNSPFVDGKAGGTIHRFVVPPFSREELRETVLQPAIQQLLEFRGNTAKHAEKGGTKSKDPDEDFVNRIIDETFANPDSLPLLSFALYRLFEMKNPSPGNLLLETDYDDFGGISGILDKKLTDTYIAYDAEHRALFCQLIYRMISFDAGYMAKRRVYTTYISDEKILNELEFTDASTMASINAIQQELVKQRLLKTSRENEAAGTKDDNVYFEPAHEALLRSSNLISQWQNEEGGAFQGRIILLNAISAAAKNYFFYEGKGKKGSLWKDDPRLSMAKRMWDTKKLYLNKIEETFIVESLRARSRAKRILWTAVITVFSLLSAASVFSYVQKEKADLNATKATKAAQRADSAAIIATNERDTAQEKTKLAQAETDTANQKTKEAQNQLAESYWQTSYSSLSGHNMLNSYLYLARALVTSKDEVNGNSMRLQLNMLFPAHIIADPLSTPDSSPVDQLQLSGDNRFLLSASAAAVNIWDIMAKKIVFSIKGKTTFHYLDGDKRLYTQTVAEIQCWDINKKTLLQTFPLAAKATVQWYTNPKMILITENNNTFLVDFDLKRSSWTTPSKTAILSEDVKRLATVAYKAGTAAVLQGRKIEVWEISPAKLTLIQSFQTECPNEKLQLSRHGNFMIGISSGGFPVNVYNVNTGDKFEPYVHYGLTVAEFTADENQAVLTDQDANQYIINLKKGKLADNYVNLFDDHYDKYHQPLGYFSNSMMTFPAASGYGDSVLVDKDENAGLWNLKTAKQGSIFDINANDKHRLVYDSTGKKIICLTTGGNLKVFGLNGHTSELETSNPGKKAFNLKTMQLSANGSTLFAANGAEIDRFNIYDTELKYEIKKNPRYVFFSGDGVYTLTVDERLRGLVFKHTEGGNMLAGSLPLGVLKLDQADNNISKDHENQEGKTNGIRLRKVIFSSKGDKLLLELNNWKLYLADVSKQKINFVGDIHDNDEFGQITEIGRFCFGEGEKEILYEDSARRVCSYNILSSKKRVICRPANDDDIFNISGTSFVSYSMSSFSVYDLAGGSIRRVYTNPAFTIKKDEKQVSSPILADFLKNGMVIFADHYILNLFDLQSAKLIKIPALLSFKHLEQTFLSADRTKVISIHDIDHLLVYDIASRTTLFAAKLNYLLDQDNYSVTVNKDESQLAVVTRQGVHLYELKTGKMTFKKFDSDDDADFIPAAAYDGFTLHYFNGTDIKVLGADIDIPADLFQLQAIAITGYRLTEYNQIEKLSATDLKAVRREYEAEASRHYKNCHYKQFNLWKQLKDRREGRPGHTH